MIGTFSEPRCVFSGSLIGFQIQDEHGGPGIGLSCGVKGQETKLLISKGWGYIVPLP